MIPQLQSKNGSAEAPYLRRLAVEQLDNTIWQPFDPGGPSVTGEPMVH
jgi:hypothetical protein